MNIYLISQSVNNDYDTYDSAVVIAEDSEKARFIHPNGSKDWNGKKGKFDAWCDASDVTVELIGISEDSEEKWVVCASFNAG